MTIRLWALASVAAVVCTSSVRQVIAAGSVSNSNVVWTTPSTTSQGSMPLGNGDISINAWTENGSDLVFYLGKTDAWDENGSLLKLGKVRVHLPTGTFSGSYQQELRLQDGTIQINAGSGSNATTVKLWIDPNNPAVQVDVQSAKAFNATVSTEPWRTQQRQLTGTELENTTYGLSGSPTPVYIEPDAVVSGQSDRILWYHRNERSVWSQNLTTQGLDPNNTVNQDPLIHNTFGAAISGDNLSSVNATTLQTTKATTRQVVSVYAMTAQTDTVQQWTNQLDQAIAKTQSISYDQRKAANDQWWSDFNKQSYIRVTGGSNAAVVSQGYALQRAMNAFAGRGASPIKFNGSIFNVDTYGRTGLGAENNLNADYRRWGGANWLQNTRMPYWSMLQSGDFQQMQPFFDYYLNSLSVAKERVKTYYGQNATGAYFPETMTPWGTWTNDNYGWNNANPKNGVAANNYIRYNWQGGLEVSAMMLQFYDFANDKTFASQKLLPFASEIVNFYDTHYSRDASGKLKIDPAQALETWATAVNPLPEIAGLQYVLGKLLALPQSLTTAQERAQWTRLTGELPAIPTRTVNGQQIFAPAQSYSGQQNSENAELYGVFPYLISGVGKSNRQMGINTFNNRTVVGNGGWIQDSIQAAMLGLGTTAQSLIAQSFQAKDGGSRFPGFYAANQDWMPNQDNGSVASIALQRMLAQVDGDSVQLFPAWPTDWDVEFRQFGPHGTILMGKYADGHVKWIDPGVDGALSQADYQLVVTHRGYHNDLGQGDFASLQLGDVNLDGRVDDADRVALLAGAVDLGIDTSNWAVVPEPGTTTMMLSAIAAILLPLRSWSHRCGQWLATNMAYRGSLDRSLHRNALQVFHPTLPTR